MPNDNEGLDAEIADTLKELEGEEGGDTNDTEESKETATDVADDSDDTEEDPKDEETEGKEKSEPEADDKGKKDSKEKKEPKAPATIPLWRVRMEEKRKAKAEAEAKAATEAAKDTKKKSAEEAAPSDDGIEALAEELGLDDNQKEVVRKIVELTAKKSTPPPEVQEFLREYPEFKKAKEAMAEQQAEREFASEIDQEVRPLVEREYPDASPELLKSITAKIRARLESDPALTHTPLSLLYKGADDFRGLAPKKKSAEVSRSGGGRQAEVIDFEELTEEQFDSLSEDQQEEYAAYMQNKERNK